MEQHELPDGWVWTTVADVISDAQSGFASGQKNVPGGVCHLRMNNIGSDCRLNLDSVLTVPPELARSRYLLKINDVLVCHTNSVKLVGKTAIFDLGDGPYAYSNHLTRLRVAPDIVDPKWLWHVLASLWRERYFETRCKQWVNQATIERQTLLDAPVPLPPLREQQRIVAKVETLLAESRTAREALAHIPALLARFRQAVLAAAFRGALVPQDPADEPASVLLERIRAARRQKREQDLRARGKIPGLYTCPEPEPLDTSGLPELPEGWVWTTVEEMGVVGEEAVKTGPFGVQLPSKEFTTSGVPVLAIGNVQWGCLSLASQDFVTEAKAQHLAKYRLRAGDVLFTRSGTVGRSAVVPAEADGWLMSYHLLRVRVDARVCLPEYLYFIFRGEAGIQERIAERSRGATRAGFNTALLRSLPIPLAPLAEQRRIVARIEALFAQGAAIEAAVAAAGRRVEHLDQSILARAFRGELVPQDPNDEPASVLLERIRREKGLGEGDDAT